MLKIDHLIVKASFRGCPISDRKTFYQSRCILPISVGQKVHEDKKFLATIQLINRSFQSCVVLIDDTIQRHTIKIHDDSPEDILYQKSLELGDQWLKRNKLAYSQLTIPHSVIRWSKWLEHELFQQHWNRVHEFYNTHSGYKEAIHKNVEEYLSRSLKHPGKKSFDYDRAFSLCVDYLKEECAGMCLWVEEECHFEVYPNGRNKAMAATYEYLIRPLYPHLLRSVALRFKKYP